MTYLHCPRCKQPNGLRISRPTGFEIHVVDPSMAELKDSRRVSNGYVARPECRECVSLVPVILLPSKT